VDAAGNLYVADRGLHRGVVADSLILKRDTQGNWSELATEGTAPGQVYRTSALAVYTAGTLYVADSSDYRVQEYTPHP
jgi:hypothetical protein